MGKSLERKATPSQAKGTLPVAGTVEIFIDNTDDHLKMIDENGSVTNITATAEGTLSVANIVDATPSLTLRDSDTDDNDIGASIVAAATATGTGVEDVDLTISAQKSGTLNALITYDASADTTTINRAAVAASTLQLSGNVTFDDAIDVVLNATTGTKIGTATSQKLGFFNAAPVIQPTALTTVETTLTNAGTASDYAIQALTDSSPFGFVTAAEGETVVEVVLNNQARINEIESKLQALGLLA